MPSDLKLGAKSLGSIGPGRLNESVNGPGGHSCWNSISKTRPRFFMVLPPDVIPRRWTFPLDSISQLKWPATTNDINRICMTEMGVGTVVPHLLGNILFSHSKSEKLCKREEIIELRRVIKHLAVVTLREVCQYDGQHKKELLCLKYHPYPAGNKAHNTYPLKISNNFPFLHTKCGDERQVRSVFKPARPLKPSGLDMN